jgi:hypothetical protein
MEAKLVAGTSLRAAAVTAHAVASAAGLSGTRGPLKATRPVMPHADAWEPPRASEDPPGAGTSVSTP